VTLYVLALSDAPVMPWEDDGRRIESLPIEGIYAIGERRSDVPAVSEAELQRQHAIVQRLADAVPAIIPARFGSLVDEEELSVILRERRPLIETALDHVRDKVQMTLRIAGVVAPVESAAPASGREYLERRRHVLGPAPPAHVEGVLRDLRSLILDERRKPIERGSLTIYHLVARADVKEYRDVVNAARVAGVAMSGPWAAFAFAPDLFS
jgi:hypothetical protein